LKLVAGLLAVSIQHDFDYGVIFDWNRQLPSLFSHHFPVSKGMIRMANQPPPVPPAGRSDKGPGGAAHEGNPVADLNGVGRAPANLREQDRQGNTKQNTTHQGYQQDR
jgi:hypothetical protein